MKAATQATSRDALASIQDKLPYTRRRVLAYIRECGAHGATCDEVEIALEPPISHQTCSARFTELRNAGQIIATEHRRKTRSGRGACVHTAKVNVQMEMFS